VTALRIAGMVGAAASGGKVATSDRSDSKSGVKGVRYNPENDSWSAYVYRYGHCYHVGTYFTKERAIAAYETALKNENPDLHTAPEKVERSSSSGTVQRSEPDELCTNERR